MEQVAKKEIPHPLRIIKKEVSPIEVGKYYLKCEFSKVFPDRKVRDPIDKVIDELADKEFWRLLEAMSFSYRLNSVFWRVSDTSLVWSEEIWNAGDLTMTGINPKVNEVVRSSTVNKNPLKFRDFLKKHFKEHPKDDPLGVGQFRPDGREVQYKTLMLSDNGKQVGLVDGSNRLIKLVMLGEQEVIAFVCRGTGSGGKMRIGDSTFWLLRNVYQRSQPEEQEAILKTAKKLGEISLDGEEAIESYWVEHVTDDELKEIGRRLLKDIKDLRTRKPSIP